MDAAYVRMNTGGHGIVGGTRIAHLMLRRVAEERGEWDTPTGVRMGLLAEIHRLTNVLVVGKNGWEMLPLTDAARTHLSREEFASIEGRIVFFTLGWYGFHLEMRRAIMETAISMSGARIESLTCTELMRSLQTSTNAENSGAMAAA